MANYTVSSGVVSSGIVISTGSKLYIKGGGEAVSAYIMAGGLEYVSSGGVSQFEIVSGGDFISSGGSTVSAIIERGGYIVVSAGGAATGTIVEAEGALNVWGAVSGGAAVNGGEVDLFSGAVATGEVYGGGAFQVISNGGVASGTIVNFDGADYVSSGGVASGSIINDGGYEVVSSAGTAVSTTLLSGGWDNVYSGGVASAATVSSGGAQVVYDGGLAEGTLVRGGGLIFVFSGGAASGVRVASGGMLVLLPGATAAGTSAASGGAVVSTGVLEVDVYSSLVSYQSGPVSSGTVTGGIKQDVLSGGVVTGVTVAAAGIEHVYAGGMTSGVYLNSGGFELVSSGAVADANILSGGQLYLTNGARASGTVVEAGGKMFVQAGAVTSATAVSSGGIQYIFSAGLSDAAVVTSGGSEYLMSGARDSGTSVNYHANEFVFSGAIASSTTVVSAGTLTVASGGQANGATVRSGATLVLSSGATASGTTLLSGGYIDLTWLAYAGGGTVSFNSTTDVVTVVEDGSTVQLQLAGSSAYVGDGFHLVSATQGTAITQNSTPACYCRGTRIQTVDGEVAVEDLAVGDLVVTHAGAMRPVRWIGRRSYGARFVQGNRNVLPILIRAGALEEGAPRRDLRISPQHALFLENLLVPAEALVNEATILRTGEAEEVHYVHVELESHDVILAEGAAAETYLDDNNRFMFQNAEEFATLYPRCWSSRPRYCAQRLSEGPAVEAIRARLAARAETLGFAVPRQLEVVLSAGVTRCTVPPGVSVLRLISSFGMAAGDGRWLGALIRGVRLDGVKVPLDDPRLAAGFNEPEDHNGELTRWTIGDALLRLGEHGSERVCEIEVDRIMRTRPAQGAHPVRIVQPGRTRAVIPAQAAELCLVSPCGWRAGDVRRLGALIVDIAIDGVPLDLAGSGFKSGFHPAERHEGRTVRWTDGVGVLAIAAAPVDRRCEIEAAYIMPAAAPPPPVVYEIAMAGSASLVVPAWAEEMRLKSVRAAAPGDARNLGVLLNKFRLAGQSIDLSDPCFAAGFHPPETHGAQQVRWTDGEALVMLQPWPVERICEIGVVALAAFH